MSDLTALLKTQSARIVAEPRQQEDVFKALKTVVRDQFTRHKENKQSELTKATLQNLEAAVKGEFVKHRVQTDLNHETLAKIQSAVRDKFV